MSSMISKRDRRAVWPAQSALRAQNEKLFAPKLLRIPAHAGILSEAEQISARLVQQHVRGHWQAACRTFGLRLYFVDSRQGSGEDVALSHALIQPLPLRDDQGKS